MNEQRIRLHLHTAVTEFVKSTYQDVPIEFLHRDVADTEFPTDPVWVAVITLTGVHFVARAKDLANVLTPSGVSHRYLVRSGPDGWTMMFISGRDLSEELK
jgi:hypothetical protein